MRKMRNDNRGASLVVVIITIGFIGILVSMLMYITFMNFKIKTADIKNKNSFYTAENALEEIKVGLQGEVSEAMGSAYLDIMQSYGMYSDDERTETFEWNYMTALREALKMPGADDKYRVDILNGYLQETAWNATTGTGAIVEADTATYGTLLMLEDGVVLKNVTVTYVSADGNVSCIKTDIRLALPEVSFNESFKLPDILSYCLIANDDLYINGGNDAFIGSLYGGRNGMEINNGAVVNVSKADLMVTDDTVTVDNGTLVIAEDCNLWTENIVVDSGKLDLGGTAYVGDDLTIQGNYSNVTIRNTYYGYGYGDFGGAANAGVTENLLAQTVAEMGDGLFTASAKYGMENIDGATEVSGVIDLSTLEYSGIEKTALELDPHFGFFKNKDGTVTVYVQDVTEELKYNADPAKGIYPSDINDVDDPSDNFTPRLYLRCESEVLQTRPELNGLPAVTNLQPDPELGPNYFSYTIPREEVEKVFYFAYTYYPVDFRMRTQTDVLGVVLSAIPEKEPEEEVETPEIIEPDTQDPVDESADNNSSILINGTHTTLDMSAVQRLYLAGNAFINTEGTVTVNGTEQTNKSVFMGESLAIKSDQLAYLVPSECLWVLNGESLCNMNPVPVDEIANYTAQGAKEVSLGSKSDVLGVALGNYAQNYQKVYRVTGGAKLVYYYLNFATEEDANEFFKAYYKADKERMDAYLKVYVDSLKLPVDSMLRVNLAGNVFDMENGKFVLNDATAATDDNTELKLESDGYANTFMQLCTTLSRVEPTAAQKGEKNNRGIFYNIVDETELGKLVAPGETKAVYNASGDIGAVIVNNATGSTYQMSADTTVNWDDIRILVTSGDLLVDHNFKGIIISGGTVTVQGGVTVEADTDGVSEAMQLDTFLTDGTASTVVNLFVEGSYVYNEETAEVGGVLVKTADLVRYENWSKE